MISNQFYDNEAARLNNLINALEHGMLDNMTQIIGEETALFEEIFINGNNDPKLVQKWERLKLKQKGQLNTANKKLVSQTIKLQSKEIENIIQSATDTVLRQGEGVLVSASEAGALKTAPAIGNSKRVNKVIENVTRIAKKDFARMNTTMLVSQNKLYRPFINRLSAEVITGIRTPQQVLRKFINRLTDDGVTGLKDSIGRTWKPDTYGDMLIRTATKESAVLATFERAKDYGNNYVEISSHSDAREKDAQDQGKIVSLDGDTTDIKDLDDNRINVISWSKTSRGDADGIFGINCRHQMYNFVPNFSTRTNKTTKELDAEAKKTGGKTVKQQAKERDTQRKLERDIRKYKTNTVLMDNVHDEQGKLKAQNMIFKKQKQMNKFIDDTGRVRRNDREQIRVVEGKKVQSQPRAIKPVETV